MSITENINFYKSLLIQYELFLSNIFRERRQLKIKFFYCSYTNMQVVWGTETYFVK